MLDFEPRLAACEAKMNTWGGITMGKHTPCREFLPIYGEAQMGHWGSVPVTPKNLTWLVAGCRTHEEGRGRVKFDKLGWFVKEKQHEFSPNSAAESMWRCK